MNLFYWIKGVAVFLLGGIFLGIWIVLTIFSAIIILPFCKTGNAKAEGDVPWFAWMPVIVGNDTSMRVKDFRWLVFLRRDFRWCFAELDYVAYYKDLK